MYTYIYIYTCMMYICFADSPPPLPSLRIGISRSSGNHHPLKPVERRPIGWRFCCPVNLRAGENLRKQRQHNGQRGGVWINQKDGWSEGTTDGWNTCQDATAEVFNHLILVVDDQICYSKKANQEGLMDILALLVCVMWCIMSSIEVLLLWCSQKIGGLGWAERVMLLGGWRGPGVVGF